jgi:hypothetical protein
MGLSDLLFEPSTTRDVRKMNGPTDQPLIPRCELGSGHVARRRLSAFLSVDHTLKARQLKESPRRPPVALICFDESHTPVLFLPSTGSPESRGALVVLDNDRLQSNCAAFGQACFSAGHQLAGESSTPMRWSDDQAVDGATPAVPGRHHRADDGIIVLRHQQRLRVVCQERLQIFGTVGLRGLCFGLRP